MANAGVCNPLERSHILEQGLDLQLRAANARQSLKLALIHLLILGILITDASNKCQFADSYWYYVEYAAMAVVGFCFIIYLHKYLAYIFATKALKCTKAQKDLLQFEDDFLEVEEPSAEKSARKPDPDEYCDRSMLSWHSSYVESRCGTPDWSFSRHTPPRNSVSPQKGGTPHHYGNITMAPYNMTLNVSSINSSASFHSPYSKYNDRDIIQDQKSLMEYLRDVTAKEVQQRHNEEKCSTLNNTSSPFWSYYNTAANLLKTSLYQLSPCPTSSAPNKQTNADESGLNIIDSNSEVIKRISSEKLSQYVANLRRWISSTILERLAKEIENIDESFKNRGLADMQIGSIGLERLKKTVENQQFVNQFMPRLPLIVPFLEMSTNQEYLVQRIKDLAKGYCIADYRWNSGSSYHGLQWDEHLPTDSAILFHLFCVYLDTQLMPLPQGGGRPFYSRYVIVGDEKRSIKDTIAAVQNRAHCAILCTNPLKPKFNFISDNQIHNCAYDRNNLFYVIIQFLIYMKTQQEGFLEGVNMGRSGINIMCVIDN